MSRTNLDDWLVEFDIPALGGQPDPAGMQAPNTGVDAGPGGMPEQNPNPQTQNPNQGMPWDVPDQSEPKSPNDDITQDPYAPDMPKKDEHEDKDFETWKNSFFKELLKGNSNDLIDMIHKIRNRELESYPRKFVEDNLQIQFLRQDSNIEKVSKEIVKNLKKELNKNSPSVSLTNNLALVLQSNPIVSNIFLKFNGLWGTKGDFHRKFIAALLNAAQVGAGGMENEDIVYNDAEFSVPISTRCNSQFGYFQLVNWAMKEDDPERFLEEAELKRLEEGSPEEKDVLMRRVILESIVNKFKTRSFLFNVIDPDGTIYFIGMDLAEMLKSSYKDGKLIVKTTEAENSDAMIDDRGKVLPYVDLKIQYAKSTGKQDEEGKPEVEEIDFLEKKNGQLILTASLQTMQDASTVLSGLVLKDFPFNGNKSELHSIQRCVPSVAEILLRRCN